MSRKARSVRTGSPPQSDKTEVPVELPEWVDRLIQEIGPGNPLRTVFFERGLRALFEFAKLGDTYLAEAISAPTDYLVLLNLLKTPDVLAALQVADPLAPALLRGIEARKRLLDEQGGVLSAEQTRSLVGLTRQAVDKRRLQGKLIAVSLGKRGYMYPAWQFTERGTILPGLERVIEVLSGYDDWTQIIFFVSGNQRLSGATPLAALKRGEIDEVIAAAEAYGEHGAA